MTLHTTSNTFDSDNQAGSVTMSCVVVVVVVPCPSSYRCLAFKDEAGIIDVDGGVVSRLRLFFTND